MNGLRHSVSLFVSQNLIGVKVFLISFGFEEFGFFMVFSGLFIDNVLWKKIVEMKLNCR